MPSEIMDQRRVSPLYVPPVSSSFFSDEIRFPAQRQVGFWKSEMVSDNLGPGRMPLASGKIISSSPSEKLLIKEPNSQLRLEQLIGVDRTGRLSMTPWKSASHGLGSQCNGKEQQVMFPQPSSLNAKENGIDMTGIAYDSGLFSSSLPGLLSKKFTQGPLFDQPIGTFNSNFDNGPFESLKEIEAQTIGNLLPDDDDLFSGVIDNVGVEHVSPTNNSDDVEDDIFYSGGGMELDANGVRNGYRAVENNIFGGEYALSAHPSRALLVNNIEKSIDDNDLKVLFERHGDIHMLYTTYKHRGFVIICYYDLRAACSAMRELQNKIVMHQNLDVHFVTSKDTSSGRNINQRIVLVSNLDSSVSKDYLNKIFGVYGEIKEIHEIPLKCGYKFVEFYDTRAAEAAFRTLNRNNIAGKIIQLELLHPEFAAHLMQKSSHEMKQEEAGLCFRKGSPPNSSTSMYYGRMPLGGVASGSLDNSAIQGQLSISHGSVSSHLENAFNGISSCGPHYQSSPVTVGHIGSHSNQQRMDDLNNSLGQLNFGLKCVPSFHPHSLPEYHNGPTDSVPYQPPNTMSSMTLNFIAHADGVDTMHVPGLNSGGLSCPSFLSSEQGSTNGVSQGHQYIWNNHSSQHHCPPGHLMWPNSPSCMNNAHSPSQLLHRLPTAPSTVLSSAPSTYHHNVGSAPTGNPSMWDRHHSYKGDSREASFFHPGSLGHMGFSGSPLHQREFASHNIFSQVGGNCIEKSLSSTHVGLPSPQQNHRMFYACRNPMIPAPTTFESPVDRIRSRRSDANSTQVDSKRQYELDIERIVREEDKRTTLMIKNIPNKYTSKMLLAAIDENHRGTYDFIYLPIDFKNKCNVGYAFINLVDPQQIIPFYKAFNGKKWEKFNSEKVASLAYARIQGKTALIAHFQNSSLMNEDKRCRPILFHSDGPNAGDQEPFPLGMNIRSRSGRTRTQNSEDNPQGSPSNSASGEDCSSGFNSSTSCSIKDT